MIGDCFIAFDKNRENSISDAHHIQKQWQCVFVELKYNNKGFIIHVHNWKNEMEEKK